MQGALLRASDAITLSVDLPAGWHTKHSARVSALWRVAFTLHWLVEQVHRLSTLDTSWTQDAGARLAMLQR